MRSFFWYALAAIGEIAGCFAFWAWLKLGKSPLWIIPGTASLILFALTLTRIDSAAAGRTYAAYGGIYIVSSLIWVVAHRRCSTGPLGFARCADLSHRRLRDPVRAASGESIGCGTPSAGAFMDTTWTRAIQGKSFRPAILIRCLL